MACFEDQSLRLHQFSDHDIGATLLAIACGFLDPTDAIVNE